MLKWKSLPFDLSLHIMSFLNNHLKSTQMANLQDISTISLFCLLEQRRLLMKSIRYILIPALYCDYSYCLGSRQIITQHIHFINNYRVWYLNYLFYVKYPWGRKRQHKALEYLKTENEIL
tara:strand:- start:1520 stop:1879 length:360 start_codon:yes stop_codon:yes gene_type:complete